MSSYTENIRPGERLFLLFLDPLVNAFCVYLPLLILISPLYFFEFVTYYAFSKCAFFLYAATYMNKDIAGGKSICKRLLGYAVINEDTGQKPRMATCFIRNITIFIYFAELIYGLFSPSRKIADYFTKLKSLEQQRTQNRC